MKKTYSLNELSEVAEEIIAASKSKVVLFNGKMGVGKTTLIKEIVKTLGAHDIASSPTFSLVNEYQGSNGEPIYHFDFYRIDDETEALDMGVEEYFYSGNWCLIEWPDKIENLLPLNSVNLLITVDDNQDRILELHHNE